VLAPAPCSNDMREKKLTVTAEQRQSKNEQFDISLMIEEEYVRPSTPPSPMASPTRWQVMCQKSCDYLLKPLDSDQESELEAIISHGASWDERPTDE
ncbi:hypothetical protein PENTCL1PPCAC_12664, partial [Pristionchus entomophagus]